MLIIGVLGISKQLHFIKNADLGFKSEKIVCLPLKNSSETKYKSFKNELLKEVNIEDVSLKDHSILGFNNTSGTLEWEGKMPEEKIWVESSYIDCNYFDMLNISFAEGRNFTENSASDGKNSIIVNESLVKSIKLVNPVGQKVKFQGKEKLIIGVIKDAHFQSLHKSIEPQVYQVAKLNPDIGEEALTIIKFKNQESVGTFTSVMGQIKKIWNEVYPELPFTYTFLKQEIENQYKYEKRLTILMYIFSGMSLLLSCMGLMAITVFIAESRIKEIGIRKVNGAKVSEILHMFNKDFITWIGIAYIVACPIAYYTINKWLENFAYKTPLSWWIFALAGIMALGIALLTVSWQSWKAATRNPVEALRYE
jgi:putative ABC transport system permease protein